MKSESTLYSTLIQPHDHALSLNWASPDELERNDEFLSTEQQYLLEGIREKKLLYNHGFDAKYFANVNPLILSREPIGIRVAYCGHKSSWNKWGHCQRWKFCSKCAAFQSKAIMGQYMPAYARNEFLFSTLSFRGYLPIGQETDFPVIIRCWKAIEHALRLERKLGYISGAYWVDEFSIQSFLPMLGTPHAHCVIHVNPYQTDASQISSDFAELLAMYSKNGDVPPGLSPNILTQHLESEEDMGNRLGYTVKPIDLTSAYSRCAAIHSDEDSIRRMNQEMTNFIHRYSSLIKGRVAIHRIGTMHHSSGDYVGVKGWNRCKRRRYARQFLARRDSWTEVR